MGRRAAAALVAGLIGLLFGASVEAGQRPEPPTPPDGDRVSIETGLELRPRRCFTFIIGDRGTIRECPIAVLGTARLHLRPAGPLLLHARVSFGVRHLRNSAWAHAITEPGEVVGAFPEDELELEIDLGVGLWSRKKLVDATLQAGPSLRVRRWTPETQARFGDVGITPASVGRVLVGGRLVGGLQLVLPESLRIGFDLGLEVVGRAGHIWSDEAAGDAELREAVISLTGWTEVRTLAGLVVIAPPAGPVAFFGRVGAATGWILTGPETRRAYEELGLEPEEWFHLWPEGRFILGVRLAPGAED